MQNRMKWLFLKCFRQRSVYLILPFSSQEETWMFHISVHNVPIDFSGIRDTGTDHGVVSIHRTVLTANSGAVRECTTPVLEISEQSDIHIRDVNHSVPITLDSTVKKS